jgi:hypothetical protein
VLRLVDHGLHGIESVDRLLALHRHRPDITYDHLPPTRPGVDAALSWAQVEWPNLVALCRPSAERGLHQRCWQLAHQLRGISDPATTTRPPPRIAGRSRSANASAAHTRWPGPKTGLAT